MIKESELRRLVPINTLPPAHFERLFAELSAETAEPGTVLFRQGDIAREWLYVLSGTVVLRSGNMDVESITGGSQGSRIALAHQSPRKVTAVAKDSIRLLRIAPEALKSETTAAEKLVRGGGYEVSLSSESEDKSEDWMSALLRSPVFLRLPPAKLQALLRNLRAMPVRAGQVIISQDQPGSDFYIIRRGHCTVTRRPRPEAKPLKLGILKAWDTFGEEALLTGDLSSTTVTMNHDGDLLQLPKTDFLTLVRDPLITFVSPGEALEIVGRNGLWLDLRSPERHAQAKPRGECINLPGFALGMSAGTLDRHRAHVCLCDDGRASAAAAFILLKHRVPAFVLRDGMAALPAEEIMGDPGNLEPPGADSMPFELQDAEVADIGRLPPIETPPLLPELSLDLVDALSDPELTAEPPHTPESSPQPKPAMDMGTASRLLDAIAADLERLYLDRERLLREMALAGLPPGPAERIPPQSDVSAELAELRRLYLDAVRAVEIAERDTEELHDYISDLKMLVRQFLVEGREIFDEESAALRTELEMVRQRAAVELHTMRHRLQLAEAEKSRLFSEMAATKVPSSVPARPGVVDDFPASPRRAGVRSRLIWPLAGVVVVAGLLMIGLFGYEPGRQWVRAWLDLITAPASAPIPRPAPAASPPAPEAPAVPPRPPR